jgi:hypothetical protein
MAGKGGLYSKEGMHTVGRGHVQVPPPPGGRAHPPARRAPRTAVEGGAHGREGARISMEGALSCCK